MAEGDFQIIASTEALQSSGVQLDAFKSDKIGPSVPNRETESSYSSSSTSSLLPYFSLKYHTFLAFVSKRLGSGSRGIEIVALPANKCSSNGGRDTSRYYAQPPPGAAEAISEEKNSVGSCGQQLQSGVCRGAIQKDWKRLVMDQAISVFANHGGKRAVITGSRLTEWQLTCAYLLRCPSHVRLGEGLPPAPELPCLRNHLTRLAELIDQSHGARSDPELWMFYLTLLAQLPPEDAPDPRLFRPVLMEFPMCWQLYYAVAQLSAGSFAGSISWNHSLLPHRASIASTAGELDPEHTDSILRAQVSLSKLQLLCDRGYTTDAIDVLCALLHLGPLFADTVGVSPARTSTRTPEEMDIQRSDVDQEVLWATLLLLLVTGRWEGHRLLMLNLNNERYVWSAWRLASAAGDGGRDRDATARVAGLFARSEGFRAKLIHAIEQAFQYNQRAGCFVKFNPGENRLEVYTDGEEASSLGGGQGSARDVGPVTASLEAIWFCVVHLASHLGWQTSDLLQAATECCPLSTNPCLLPAAPFLNSLHTNSAADCDSVMALCMEYFRGTETAERFHSEEFSSVTLLALSQAYCEVRAEETVTRAISGRDSGEPVAEEDGAPLWPLYLLNSNETSSSVLWKDTPSDADQAQMITLFWRFYRYTEGLPTGTALAAWILLGRRLNLFQLVNLGKFSTFFDQMSLGGSPCSASISCDTEANALSVRRNTVLLFYLGFVVEVSAAVPKAQLGKTHLGPAACKDIIKIFFELVELHRLPTPTSTAVTAVPAGSVQGLCRASLRCYWEGEDLMAPTLEHVYLFTALDILTRFDLLDLTNADLALQRSLLTLANPDFLIKQFLIWYCAQRNGELFFISSLESAYSPALIGRLSPELCWRLFLAAWRHEKLAVAETIRIQLKSREGCAAAMMWSARMDSYVEYGGVDPRPHQNKNKSYRAPVADKGAGTPAISIEDAEAGSSRGGVDKADENAGSVGSGSCSDDMALNFILEDTIDLSQLPYQTLFSLHKTCLQSIVHYESAAEDAVPISSISFSGAFGGDDRVPLSLCHCNTVKEINLSHNFLTRVPNALANFGPLTRLDLSWNSLSTLPVEAASFFPNLRVINLSHNKFQKFPQTLFDLSFLIELHMSDNALEYLPPKITTMKHLKGMDLSNNQIK
eukprot:gene1474-1692_t